MLIGLNGRKQAGKDTVFERASWIMRDVVEVERVSFADLLYRSAAEAIGVTVEQLREWKSNDSYRVQAAFYDGARRWTYADQSVREYLQRYGTEAHRDVFGPDFWTEQVRPELEPHDGRIVMVTDARFPNEAELVRACGGAVVEVIGPMGRATDDAHPSEAPLPEGLVDAVITNTVRDDEFRTLDGQVDTLIRLHLGGVA